MKGIRTQVFDVKYVAVLQEKAEEIPSSFFYFDYIRRAPFIKT